MVQSIIEGLRNYLAECPLLSEIPVKDRHVDWTAADINGNYGIFADGNDPIGEPYINGDWEMLYTAQINVRKLADPALNIRAQPSLNAKINGVIRDKGIYTIVAEARGDGVLWGKLKSGAGWISLGGKYVKKF